MVKIVIPGELLALNQYSDAERGNRYHGSNLKRYYTTICSMYTKKAMHEGLKVTGKIDIYCHWYMKDKRKDKDNIRFAIKFIQDGMKQAGLIKNDGWKEIGNYYDEFSVDKDNPRVEVEIKKHEKM
ncbi:RusA family crossover junction endodeoxyribonuclease [Lentilactobacillus sp. SPB1-3]|uniref:RusA family crossover junction endodeoxyribonuclease n=1 Tax=Lentilactobacillus terminaliae TaxID=3003483 RepID=A0ACD5DDX8_9LACO|nr:RusA family crossover junction endodeoxyribonuclease [Lentilactobacillus sp. SPB1-3]MCZ0978062.1 RusA family crossover junction endodeoxyribonuclease [Lentilactobacillus sp. SPB1-3]